MNKKYDKIAFKTIFCNYISKISDDEN